MHRSLVFAAASAALAGAGLALPASFSASADTGGRSAREQREPERADPSATRMPTRPTRKRATVPAYVVARPRGAARIAVRSRPGGPVTLRVAPETEFGSPQTLGVVRRRGEWLAVVHPELGNGRVGWVNARRARVKLANTRINIVIDRSERLLLLRRGARVLQRVRVAVGRAESPTPLGRFAVTDKLPGSRYGAYYGCCILALTARQPSLPAGWTGGDRIAIHGTNAPGSVGQAVSAGCPRARDDDLRVLMRRVPLGAPVFVTT